VVARTLRLAAFTQPVRTHRGVSKPGAQGLTSMKRCPVEDIQVREMEAASLDPPQADDGEANRVGSGRGADALAAPVGSIGIPSGAVKGDDPDGVIGDVH
jgi:hypothetical protein